MKGKQQMPKWIISLVLLITISSTLGGVVQGTKKNALTDKEAEALVAKGEKLAQRYTCRVCHSTQKIAGGSAPTFWGLYGSTVELEDGTTVQVDDEYLRRSITAPALEVHKGFESEQMQVGLMIFQDKIQNGDNLQAIVEYIKSLR